MVRDRARDAAVAAAPLKVLAVLQNQWFPPADAARVREIMARASSKGRRRLTAFFLFRACHTGKVLQSFFPDCRDWVWENASPEIGERPGAVFPADSEHLWRALVEEQPTVVLAFGRVASDALAGLTREYKVPFFYGPHPASRGGAKFEAYTLMRSMLAELQSITKTRAEAFKSGLRAESE